MRDSPRKAAIAAGMNSYRTSKPCPKGHVGFHYVSGGCMECARLLSAKNNKRLQDKNPGSQARRMKIEGRKVAIEKGELRFSTGFPCRNGHVSERYVSTGECIACLKRHVPTKERKRATYLRMVAKKTAVDPKWRTKQTYRWRAKYPFKYRVEKLFKTARIHARTDKVTLDFDAAFIATLLEEAIVTGSVIAAKLSPLTASLDKIDIRSPICKANIQIVPWWFNRAKWRWNQEELIEAMRKFGFIRSN